MTANLIQFPHTRRVDFVRRAAVRFSDMAPSTAEKQLRALLKRQGDVMIKRGFAPEVVQAELYALECRIRAEMWRVVLTPGGAA